jgi:hypothetical protein
MGWKLISVPDSEEVAEDLSDEELVSLYLLLQHRMKGPYDESNPEFSCYLKLWTPFNEAHDRMEQGREGSDAARLSQSGDRLLTHHPHTVALPERGS